MKRSLSLLVFVVSLLAATAASATTWYVRPDGGTRYSSVMTSGQCNGQSDAKYPGSGVNQNCAFGDYRWLYQDGSYAANDGTSNYSFPHWGWVIQGGDTVIVRGSLGTGVSYRIGWDNPNSAYIPSRGLFIGLSGDPYSSNPPAFPSGKRNHPTRILGENYQSCSAASAKTQLHGGYAVGVVLQMAGASYVDVECMDVTDFSSCGLQGQQQGCNKDVGSLADFADSGVYWTNTSTHDTLNNIHIHGLALNGMSGSPGDGTVLTNIDMIGNASSGWNADAGNHETGVGSLLMQKFNISWNGCAEEYPVTDALPYNDCNDDSNGGYGDGFGTATVVSVKPWNVHFDQGVVSYNTQDGLDALHLIGGGSSMTITRVLAYGNMGEQLKNGGSNGSIENSVIVGNCYAMENAIPGTPSGYNKHLSDFCRAGNNGVLITSGKNANVIYRNNTMFSPNAIGILLQCDQTEGVCDNTSTVDIRNNIFVGYVGPHNSDFPTPIYLDQGTSDSEFTSAVNPFLNKGSFNSNNVTYNAKSNWTCPALWQAEKNALCSDPALKDESEKLYGYNNATPLQGSEVIGSGVTVAGLTQDFDGLLRAIPTSRGAIDPDGKQPATPTDPSDPTSPTPPSTPTVPVPPPPYPTKIVLSASKGTSADNPAILTATVTPSATNDGAVRGLVQIFTASNWPLAVGILNANGVVSWQVPVGLTGQTVYGVFLGSKTYTASKSTMLSGPATMQTLY